MKLSNKVTATDFRLSFHSTCTCIGFLIMIKTYSEFDIHVLYCGINLTKILNMFYALALKYVLINSEALEIKLALQSQSNLKNEPPHGKTNNLHRRKQRRRSASR